MLTNGLSTLESEFEREEQSMDVFSSTHSLAAVKPNSSGEIFFPPSPYRSTLLKSCDCPESHLVDS